MRRKSLTVLLMVVFAAAMIFYGCNSKKEKEEESQQPPKQEETIPGNNGNDAQSPDDENIDNNTTDDTDDKKPGNDDDESDKPNQEEEKVKVIFIDGDNRIEEIFKKGEFLRKPSDPQKIGWFFWDWVDSNGDKFTFDNPINADLEIYAQWVPLITFETGNGSKVDEIVAVKDYELPQEPTYEKHRFAGWYENPDFDGEEFVFNSQEPPKSPITLHALWIEQVTITFADGYESIIVDKGTLTNPPEETELGDNFVGWYDEQEEIFDFSKPVTKDVTLHAKYKEIKWHEGEWRGWYVDFNVYEYYLVVDENGNLDHEQSYYYYYDFEEETIKLTEEYTFDINEVNETFTIIGQIGDDDKCEAKFEYTEEDKLILSSGFNGESFELIKNNPKTAREFFFALEGNWQNSEKTCNFKFLKNGELEEFESYFKDETGIIFESLSNYEITIFLNEEDFINEKASKLIYNPDKKTLTLHTSTETIVLSKTVNELPEYFIGEWQGTELYNNTEYQYTLTIDVNAEFIFLRETADNSSSENMSEYYSLTYTDSGIHLIGISEIYGEVLFLYDDMTDTLVTETGFMGSSIILHKSA